MGIFSYQSLSLKPVKVASHHSPDYDYDPYEKAKMIGAKVIEPKANELFLDIDTDEQMAIYETNLQVMQGFVQARETKRSRSMGGNWHIVVTLDRDVDLAERIALQASLGSDPKRELLSMMRLWFNQDVPPTLFFEK